MNGIIRTRMENFEVEGVSSIQIVKEPDSLSRMVDVIKFYDAYGNSKDVRFASFLGFTFQKPEDVMVAEKEKGSLPHNIWLQNAHYIVCVPSEKLMTICYEENGRAAFYHIYNTDKIHEIVFEEEEA